MMVGPPCRTRTFRRSERVHFGLATRSEATGSISDSGWWNWVVIVIASGAAGLVLAVLRFPVLINVLRMGSRHAAETNRQHELGHYAISDSHHARCDNASRLGANLLGISELTRIHDRCVISHPAALRCRLRRLLAPKTDRDRVHRP